MDRPASNAAATQDVLGLGRGGKPRRFTWRSLLWAAGTLALAAGAYVVYFDGKGKAGQTFVTQPVTRGNLTVQVTATGSVQPTNKVDVSSELSGVVRKVHVDYNSVVKIGDLLAELDTDKLKATVESSRAKLETAKSKVTEAEATLDEKRRDYDRKNALVTRQAASVQDLDAARAAFDRAAAAVSSARSEVGVAEAQLHLDETNLAKARITSPIDGIVLSRNVDPGQTVASSFQAPVLFTLAEDLKKMEIRVDVDEADVGAVGEGQTATFTVDAYPYRRFPARIRMLRFGSEVVQGVVTYKAVLTVDNSHLLLRPGMTATATITVSDVKDALLVPNAALRFSPSAANPGGNRSLLQRLMPSGPPRSTASRPDARGPNRTVWVLRNGAPAAVAVTVGLTDGRLTEIRTGELKPGDRVIVDAVAAKP
ncbi:MAG: efflux RND transporter periplasmic adaptor subunit [Candidatus Odyssella sp.]|nr:efflux RND transporter periplasmic adaptor subunit [Candidatus Odyssella sp.]